LIVLSGVSTIVQIPYPPWGGPSATPFLELRKRLARPGAFVPKGADRGFTHSQCYRPTEGSVVVCIFSGTRRGLLGDIDPGGFVDSRDRRTRRSERDVDPLNASE
jgi:hypothetical protein